MSVNKARPHLLVLPEDDANRQVANGFHLAIDPARARQMQVLPVAGGWGKVLEQFECEHAQGLRRWPERSLLLLIDFDEQQDRLADAKGRIPPDVADRVFVLGSWSEPERLKPNLGSFEAIGRSLAQDCRDGTEKVWSDPLLRHNGDELRRLNRQIRPVLF